MQSPTVQVHVLGTCNLKCAHCYSESGPNVRDRLDTQLLEVLFVDIAGAGYERVAFSGGEPLLHSELPQILRLAKDAGLSTSLTTNGTLFDKATWRASCSLLDIVAVSVDGPPELHNEIRRSSSAFSRLVNGLEILRDSKKPFGFIHTVTQRSVDHLFWLGEFAAEQGASLLQLHPLGLVGAGRGLEALHPDGETMARAKIIGLALQQKHEFKVQTDLFNKEFVAGRPDFIYAHEHCGSAVGPLAHLVNPLVVMANGDVSPVCHGMPSALRLGSLHRDRLKTLDEAWRREGYAEFRNHCRRTWEQVGPTLDWPYFNWYEILERAPVETMHRPGVPVKESVSVS